MPVLTQGRPNTGISCRGRGSFRIAAPVSVIPLRDGPMLGALPSQVVEHPKPITVGILRSELPKVVGSGSEILDD